MLSGPLDVAVSIDSSIFRISSSVHRSSSGQEHSMVWLAQLVIIKHINRWVGIIKQDKRNCLREWPFQYHCGPHSQ